MRPETLNRVRLAIRTWGFRPKPVGAPAQDRPCADDRTHGAVDRESIFRCSGALGRSGCAGAGLRLLLCNTYREPEREREYAEAFMSQGSRV